MSLAQIAKKAANVVTGRGRQRVTFRTTYCRPIIVRNPQTGLSEESSRVVKAGDTIDCEVDDPEIAELLERKYAYIEGTPEPTEPPRAGAPISSPRTDGGADEQTLAAAVDRLTALVERLLSKGGAS